MTDYATNIRSMYERASVEDRDNGLAWYIEAHAYAVRLSERYNTSVESTARVIAMLSPGSSWTLNMRDADAMLKHWRKGRKTVRTLKVSTYGANKLKAWDYLTNDKEYEEPKTSGLKTYNFYRNILNPLDAYCVTVDRHAYRVAQGEIGHGKKSMTAKVYRTIAAAYREVASTLNVLPCELQAVTWLAYRTEAGLT